MSAPSPNPTTKARGRGSTQGTPAAPFIFPYTDWDKAATKLLNIFQGRDDAYAVQKQDGSYRPVRRPLTLDVTKRHLKGEVTVGVYLITPVKNTCHMMVIDVDRRSKAMAKAMIAAARDVGLRDDEFLLESSGSKGFHLWTFFEESVQAGKALLFGRGVAAKADVLDEVEVFPKQARVAADGFGNLIKLPGRHAKSGNYSCFFSPELRRLDFSALEIIRPICTSKLEAVTATLGQFPGAICRNRSGPVGAFERLPPCVQRIFCGVHEGQRNECAFRLAIHFKDLGVPCAVTLGALRAWNRLNTPPSGESELARTVRQAYEKDYHIHRCPDARLGSLCDPSRCPLARRF